MATTPFFQKFPTINYNGEQLFNICERVSIANTIQKDTSAFMPYNLQYENETAETVAFDYYNSIDLYWIVSLTNNMYDPYMDWLIPDNVLDNILEGMYGSLTASQETNLFYQRIPTSNSDPYVVYISTTSNTEQNNDTFNPVNAYQKAVVDNEAKRQIYLIRTDIAQSIDSAVGTLFNNGS